MNAPQAFDPEETRVVINLEDLDEEPEPENPCEED
jgi:hypothetical protein